MTDPGERSSFAYVVERPVAMTMLFLAALVFGWVSYARLPIALMPDVSYPTLTVRTTYEGAAPQEVELQISRPVEEALATLDGLVTLESRSRAGLSDVVLGFNWGTDMAAAGQSVREQLQGVFLPDDADRPLLLRYDPSAEPFLRLALGYDPAVLDLEPEGALLLMRDLADHELRRLLEGIDGVAAVRIRGGFEPELRVEVREDWLAARRLTLDAVRQALAAENVNLAGGSIYEGNTEYLVRTLNEYRTLDELNALRIRRSDGVLVPITDVAVIREGTKERTVLSRLDGAEAVELEVYREADANVVEVAERVKGLVVGTPADVSKEDVEGMPEGPMREAMQAQLDAARPMGGTLPEGVRVVVLDDQAAFISLAIDNLRDSVLLGGVLAVAILFLFLRSWRATFIIGLAIPASLVLAFAPFYLLDVSLNLMSLGGLALGVGMLVDNAVVVLEAIQRYLDEGADRVTASIRGTSEIAVAVVSSTLTTVAVFVPLAFVEGVGGALFGDLSLAVVGSLMASLAVALLLVPTLAALTGEIGQAGGARTTLREAVAGAGEDWRTWRGAVRGLGWLWLSYALVRWFATLSVMVALWCVGWTLEISLVVIRWIGWLVLWPLAWVAERVADGFERVYQAMARAFLARLPALIRRPLATLGVAIVAFVVSLQVLAGLGTEVMPEVHQGRFVVEMALPIGTPLRETVQVAARVEDLIRATPGVEAVYATVGADDRADARSDEGEHTARLRVEVAPGADLAAREEATLARVRDSLADVPRAEIRFSRPSLFAFRTPLEVMVFGADLDELEVAGRETAAALAALPGLTDVRTSLVEGNPEVRLTYDRQKLARLGLDTNAVASTVRDRLQGARATEIHGVDRRLELRVQLTEAQRSSVADLRRLNVNPAVVPPVPLEAVATLEEAVGPSEVRRVDQRRAVVVSASVQGFDMGTATGAVEAAMRKVRLNTDQEWALGGQARELGAALQGMAMALLLAVFLVYVVMAMTFEHLVHPLVILFSVPLAVIGVAAGLGLWGLPVSVVAVLGLVVLAGVVVNNAIVLVDTVNQLRAEGLDRLAAIERAAALRLRPILITAATTVLGLVPVAMGSGSGAEVQRPLAVAVMGGLTVSTVLTLVVVPAVYLLATREGDAPRAEAP